APFLDRHDIAAGEDWEERLADLIKSADTVVFVVSPASVKSSRCAWEVDKALSLGKRLIPVVSTAVTEADVPKSLKRLNYIFFDKQAFAPLRELADALRTDVAWIREHTRIGELSFRWLSRNKPEELLLRGSELENARNWVGSWKSGGPEI